MVPVQWLVYQTFVMKGTVINMQSVPAARYNAFIVLVYVINTQLSLWDGQFACRVWHKNNSVELFNGPLELEMISSLNKFVCLVPGQ